MDVGERIKELREKAGFTQNKLAEWAGVSQTHLRRVELGQQDITIGQLRLVCDGLGVTLAEFFAVNEKEENLTDVIAKLTPKQKQLLMDFLKSI
ncbi:helix-turn-helix domain-containing protein [Pumilibacter muris]|jgi:transcriptional regulator with XRE-family HTH domain|uniref:helix-turn-helix domain-containing protein n=1 Tax=Pumilibacter muris TaxID=2941510 RepID=UPI00203ACA8A|nr:helix-turn-helix transcriptional regulator [Pumilibacter muris]